MLFSSLLALLSATTLAAAEYSGPYPDSNGRMPYGCCNLHNKGAWKKFSTARCCDGTGVSGTFNGVVTCNLMPDSSALTWTFNNCCKAEGINNSLKSTKDWTQCKAPGSDKIPH